MGVAETSIERTQRKPKRPASVAPTVYWRLSRGMTLGVRALVIDEQRQILLVQHSHVRGWHLPGGGVEPGET